MSEAAQAPAPSAEELQRRLEDRRRASTDPASGSSSSDEESRPGVRHVDCVCTAPGHQGESREFTVPVVFLGPGRPIGPVPENCPDCVAEQRRREVRLMERGAERAAEGPSVLELVERAGGNPYAFGRYRLESFPAQPGQLNALRATREFIQAVLASRDKYDQIRGLYLQGATGAAKTQLLHLALIALIEAGLNPGQDVIYDSAYTLGDRIQDTYNANASTWEFLERRIRAKVWLVDDLMAEKATTDVARKFVTIFNEREGKPTAVTSNHLPDHLTTRHEEYSRLVSRFGTRYFRIVGVQSDQDMRFVLGGVDA